MQAYEKFLKYLSKRYGKKIAHKTQAPPEQQKQPGDKEQVKERLKQNILQHQKKYEAGEEGDPDQ